MTRTLLSRSLVLLTLVLMGTSALPATTQKALEKFTAFAVALNQPGSLATSTVDVQVTRWSTQAEQDQIRDIILKNDPDELAKVLDKLPRAGMLTPTGTLGIEFQYATQETLRDGTTRIFMLTQRPIAYWPIVPPADLANYPFSYVELRIKGDGPGDGKLSLASRVLGDKAHRVIQFQDYINQPIILNKVQRQR